MDCNYGLGSQASIFGRTLILDIWPLNLYDNTKDQIWLFQATAKLMLTCSQNIALQIQWWICNFTFLKFSNKWFVLNY